MLQRIAACCNVWQCVAVSYSVYTAFNCLCCSVLQCVLQCVAVCCSVLQYVTASAPHSVVCVAVRWCGAVRCSVMQCGAVRCSAEQCAVMYCSVLQRIAETKKKSKTKTYAAGIFSRTSRLVANSFCHSKQHLPLDGDRILTSPIFH